MNERDLFALDVIWVQRRAARYACHRHHNTSSVTEMIHSLDWSTLQERRLKTRLHIFYKIINNKIAIWRLRLMNERDLFALDVIC
jgi:hypothetical protein